LPIKQKPLSGNALRGHLAKFGLVAAKGIDRVDAPIAKAATGAPLPDIAKAALQAAENRRQRIRPACVRVRARFSAWLGATPRQNARGGKILWRLSAHQGHLMPFAQEPGSITKQGKWSIRRPRVPGEAIAGQAIAAERHRWRAGGGHAERRPARLAGRASFAQVRATGRRRFGQRACTDHFSRYDDRRGVSHAGLKTSLGKRCRCATFQNIRFGESETDVLNGTVEIEHEGHPISCPCLQPSPSNSIRARGHGSAQ
jgi:hypothetical protein